MSYHLHSVYGTVVCPISLTIVLSAINYPLCLCAVMYDICENVCFDYIIQPGFCVSMWPVCWFSTSSLAAALPYFRLVTWSVCNEDMYTQYTWGPMVSHSRLKYARKFCEPQLCCEWLFAHSHSGTLAHVTFNLVLIHIVARQHTLLQYACIHFEQLEFS